MRHSILILGFLAVVVAAGCGGGGGGITAQIAATTTGAGAMMMNDCGVTVRPWFSADPTGAGWSQDPVTFVFTYTEASIAIGTDTWAVNLETGVATPI